MIRPGKQSVRTRPLPPPGWDTCPREPGHAGVSLGWIMVQGKGSLFRCSRDQWSQFCSFRGRIDLPVRGPVTRLCAWVVLRGCDMWSADPTLKSSVRISAPGTPREP